MDNGTTVQDANNSPVDAGGGSKRRVTDTNAESLGGQVVMKYMILQIVQTDKVHNIHKTQVAVYSKILQ